MHEITLTPPVMEAFYAEMAKVAAFPEALMSHLRRAGTRNAVGAGIGGGFGLGLGAGAAAGGSLGAKRAYEGARERGAGVPGAVLSAVGGGLGGAIRGAGKGALIGAGAGALAGAATPTRILAASRGLQKLDNVAGTLNNFGQRQLHSLTGWKPGGAARSVERIGAGAAPARRELSAALKAGDPGEVAHAQKALGAAEKAQGMGLTSLPGYARSVRDNGLLPTAAAGLRSQWDASGAKGKALMVGLPALSVASAARQSDGEGPGRGERIGKIVGGTLGGVAAPLSLAGSLALSAGLERAGGAVGKVVDRRRGRASQRPEVPQEPSRPPASEPGDTGQHAVEHVYGTGFNGGGLE